MSKRIEKSIYGQRILETVAKFPGASAVFGKASKHNFVTLSWGGKSRDVIFPASPSDHRGALNCASDCAKVLTGLGAVRVKSEKRGQPLTDMEAGSRGAEKPWQRKVS